MTNICSDLVLDCDINCVKASITSRTIDVVVINTVGDLDLPLITLKPIEIGVWPPASRFLESAVAITVGTVSKESTHGDISFKS